MMRCHPTGIGRKSLQLLQCSGSRHGFDVLFFTCFSLAIHQRYYSFQIKQNCGFQRILAVNSCCRICTRSAVEDLPPKRRIVSSREEARGENTANHGGRQWPYLRLSTWYHHSRWFKRKPTKYATGYKQAIRIILYSHSVGSI